MVYIVTKTRKLLANNIVYYRVKNGWSQDTLADKLDTKRQYLCEIENEKRNVSTDYIDRLAATFDIEPHELLLYRPPVDVRRIDGR